MYESTDKDVWRVFREHHYLSAEMNKGCRLFLIYWEETLVGMFSVLNQPSGSYKYAYRIHRVVILPDFQGLGCGSKIIDFFGNYFIKEGNKLFLRTTHTRFANHCRNSNYWIEGSSSKKISNAGGKSHEKKYKNYDRQRIPYSFEYVGVDYNSKEHQHIICLGEDTYENAQKQIEEISDNSKFKIIVTGIADIHSINNFEKYAVKNGIRTELLYIKSKDDFNIVKKYLNDKFDVIATTKEAQDQIKPYKDNIKSMITYDFRVDPPKLWKRIKN